MTDHEFGQAVMVAAGVAPTGMHRGHTGELGGACAKCGQMWFDGMWGVPCYKNPHYPDPLSADGFDALWDSLVAKGYFVRIASPRAGGIHCARVYRDDDLPVVDNTDRKAALLAAAAAALGVKRETGGKG